MRATSTFRNGADGKYDPKAEPLSNEFGEKSNFDNFRVPPGGTHVVLDAHGPGAITHHVVHVPRACAEARQRSRARRITRSF